MNLVQRQSIFQNPPAEYRGKPFWAWNGRLEEEELLRQIDIMKQMGFGGYFMHSRTGLATEYLGEEWFRLINRCAAYGGEKEMETWLYDDDRWPSGCAGGLATEEEIYRAMYLTMHLAEPEEYAQMDWKSFNQSIPMNRRESGMMLAAFACRLDEDHIMKSKRRLKEGISLNEGETALLFYVNYASGSSSFNGNSYVNTMNKEAIEHFIQITHEAYKENCGDKLGKEILGIFTDEPHRGGMFTEFDEAGKQGCPYTPGMLEEFEKRFGYSLLENLPELFLRKCKGEISKVTRDFFELCQELFLECFASPIAQWCRENKLIFTGHVLHEDSLCAQAAMQGSLMRFYEYMDYPGMDLLTEHNQCYWAAKQLSSVARQLGKKWVLSELNGGTGWQMSFRSYKNVGDWQALLGVNLRCPHLSWYTMKGEAKRDYPASILHQSAWYQDCRYLEDYYARIHAALCEGEPECRLLVLNPIESVWARAYSGAFDVLSAADEEIRRLEEQYVWVFHALMKHQIDFDYGEEDLMQRYGKVENGMLRIGNGVYDKVLVAGIDTMRLTTLKLLQEFAAQGGQVIFAGAIPEYVDAEKSGSVEEFTRQPVVKTIPWKEKALAGACRSGGEVEVFSADSSSLFVQSFRIAGGRMIMLLNVDRENTCQVELNLGKGRCLERWNPRTGEVVRPVYTIVDGSIRISIHLEAGGERLYLVTDIERELPVEKSIEVGETIVIPKTFRYKLSEKNICVLDRASVDILGKEEVPVQEVLKADRKLRDILGLPHRGGDMLQPWFEEKKLDNNKQPLASVRLNFAVQIDSLPKAVELVVEEKEYITGIFINDKPVFIESCGKWIDICFDRIPVPDEVWREGKNTLIIERDYDKTSGLEAVYLLGDFGVTFQGSAELPKERIVPVLNVLPSELKIGDITAQGLPFYSGGITYYVDGMREKTVVVEVKDFGGALVKLRGKEEIILAFPPYRAIVEGLEAVEVVLTRRNTFGPLHQFPKVSGAYGPENFMTEGESWREEYQLYEQGILEDINVWKVCGRNGEGTE